MDSEGVAWLSHNISYNTLLASFLLLFSSELPRNRKFFERDFHRTDDNVFFKFSPVLLFNENLLKFINLGLVLHSEKGRVYSLSG